jgi:hypothetical protein
VRTRSLGSADDKANEGLCGRGHCSVATRESTGFTKAAWSPCAADTNTEVALENAGNRCSQHQSKFDAIDEKADRIDRRHCPAGTRGKWRMHGWASRRLSWWAQGRWGVLGGRLPNPVVEASKCEKQR